MMQISRICYLLLLFSAGAVHAKLAIVHPYPRDIYAFEGTDVENTCIAYDEENSTLPARIAFIRQDEYGQIYNVTDATFTSSTELEGRKLLTTMYIENVTENDGSEKGGKYECWVFENGKSQKSAAHGFRITVILKKNLPGIKVSADIVATPEENVYIDCNATINGEEHNTQLTEITWMKEGRFLARAQNPDPDDLSTALSHTIDSVELEDGGTYTCRLHFLLWDAVYYNITGNVTVSVKPGFVGDISDKEVESKHGESVQFKCAARGPPPLLVEWKRQRSSEEQPQCINGTKDSYNITRKDHNSPYVLTINNVTYNDEGKYFCCLPTNCSNSTTGCQEWTLQVEGAVTSSSTLQLVTIYLTGFTAIITGIVFMLLS